MGFDLRPVKQLVAYSAHGGFLKAAALGCRAAFLILAVPFLLDGELATYVYINSISLVLAMLLILGLNDELPRQIGGDLAKASGYFFCATLLTVLSSLALALAIKYPNTETAIVLFTLTLSSGRFIGGITRGINIRVFEFSQNVPWILFIGIVLYRQPEKGIELIITMAACMLIVQWSALTITWPREHCGEAQVQISAKELLGQAFRHGTTRLFSNLFVLGFVRGIVFWPVWLSIGSNNDELAFAVAVGGVISQFGIIPVNRIYAQWCAKTPTRSTDWREALTIAGFWSAILATASLSAFALAWFFGWLPQQINNEWLMIQALLFYSLMPAFLLVRYLLWARGLYVGLIIGLTMLMFFAQAITIAFFPLSYWLLGSIIIVLLAIAILASVSKSQFAPQI